MDCGSLFHSSLRNSGFLEMCYHFSYSHGPIFNDTWRNDSRRQENEYRTYFGTDPAYTHIRVNAEIRIQIPDHILGLAEFVLRECSCYHYNSYSIVIQLSGQISGPNGIRIVILTL